jgi:predicted DNA binding protein
VRELVFDLEYEPGSNAVADTLAEHPDARIRSLSLHATPESLWRVDHVTGPADALDAIRETFLEADYYADCLTTEHCGATQTTNVLQHTDDTLVLYSYWERTPACSSVPHLALDHLGEGVLFETRHEGRRYRWRVLHGEDGDVRAFFDDVESAVGDAAVLEIRLLTEAGAPDERRAASGADGSLPEEQTAALRAAVEQGYYETPREVDLGELADLLDVPRSTLTYRLRRAEAHLAESAVADLATGDLAPDRP